jgi:SAM-dependent methyltransferase
MNATSPAGSRLPDREIEEGNPWYTSDQFAEQLGHPAYRHVVTNRWKNIECGLDRWCASRAHTRVRALDAGCGDGINLAPLSEMLRYRVAQPSVIGTDYSALRLGRASAIESPLVQSSLCTLPFADDAYEIILCNQVLEHIGEVNACLRELHRVLSPGGLLILGVPNEGCYLAQIRNQVIQRRIRSTTDHVNFYTARTLTRDLATAGFHVDRVLREGFFFPHLRLHTFFGSSPRGRRFVDWMRRTVSSQSAGLIAFCTKTSCLG